MKQINYPGGIFAVVALVFSSLFTLAGAAHAQVYMTKHGHVQFVSHSTLEDFTGKSDYLVGRINLADSTVQFYIDLTTVSTGVRLRDEHMQEEYLQTDKYPFAQFSGKIVSSFNPASADTQQVTVKGTFKVHNVSHVITVSGKVKISPQKLYVYAAWPVKLGDYNIRIPQVLFMKVSPTQAVSISTTLDRTKNDKSSKP
ncbi:MAG TPA: YceI family protein [Balneolales bacterium]|nr:YceI family protein [Balneolales bacterium]